MFYKNMYANMPLPVYRTWAVTSVYSCLITTLFTDNFINNNTAQFIPWST